MATSAHLDSLQGICPQPFLQEDNFPPLGGSIPGRFCMPLALLNNTSCCLPCPSTDWTYPDGFEQRAQIANWVNVAALVLTAYLLLSFLVLPVKWTHRHYLSICLAIGVVFLELAFIIPLAVQPDQCFNEITPNDMQSNITCAFSGAFLIFGGWAIVIWVFVRALSLHMQICWAVVPGKKALYASLFFGWAIPATGVGLALGLTGVSYRFGNVCHINHNNGLPDFWGPLLGLASIALVLQFITLGYCIQVYVKSLLNDETTDSSKVPSYSGSTRTASARQTYQRVKRIIQLQWRGATVVLLIIGEAIFFTIVFVSMDSGTRIDASLIQKAQPWVLCLVESGGNKNQCLHFAEELVKAESVVLAVLIVLGLSGFWCLIFLGRWSMLLGWLDLWRRRFSHRHEFVSADARRLSNRTYEMLGAKATPNPDIIKSPDRAAMTNSNSPYSPTPEGKGDYFFGSTSPRVANDRAYISPLSSYSTPRPPSVGGPGTIGREWGPQLYSPRRAGGLTGGAAVGVVPGAALSADFSV